MPNTRSSDTQPSQLTTGDTTSTAPKVVKRTRMNKEEQFETCLRYFEVSPKITQKDLCAWAQNAFDLDRKPTQGCISRILKNYNFLKELPQERLHCFSSKSAKFPLLEAKLVEFVKKMESEGSSINRRSIRDEAERLCKSQPELVRGHPVPLFSNGWFEKFLKRNQLRYRLMYNRTGKGEQTSPEPSIT